MNLAFDLITKFEGYSNIPYKCPAGYLTIGFGRRIVSYEQTTKAAEINWLNERIAQIEASLQSMQLQQHQLAALTSFIYNVGQTAFNRSTLKKKILVNDLDAPIEILRWNKVNGKPVLGLIKRRIAEYTLYTCAQNTLQYDYTIKNAFC